MKFKLFNLNPPVDLEFRGPRATNKLLKETYGGIGLDVKKMDKLKKGKGKGDAAKTNKVAKGGKGVTVGQLDGKFAEDGVSKDKSSDQPQPAARMVNSSLPNKSSTVKVDYRPIETKIQKLDRIRRDKLENDTRFRFSKEKNVKKLHVPMGFKATPWLPTDTEDASMTISEESSDCDDETIGELEANDILGMARHGVTYQELTGTKLVRPYNTHLIYENKKDQDLQDQDDDTTPDEEPTEDSRNRQESIITELGDFIHVQSHFDEVMKRPAVGTATIKKGQTAFQLYEEDKPKTIGFNRAKTNGEPDAQASRRMSNSMAGFLVSDRLLKDIGITFKNIYYPEQLVDEDIGSLPSDSKIKLKEGDSDPELMQNLEAFLYDRQPIYKTIHRHQNIYSSDEENLDTEGAKHNKHERFLDDFDYIQNKSLLIHQLSIRHDGDTRIDLTPDTDSDNQPGSARSRDSQKKAEPLPSFLQEEETLPTDAVMQAFGVDESGLFRAQKKDARTHLENYKIYKKGKFVADPKIRKPRQPSLVDRIPSNNMSDDDRSQGIYHMSISNPLLEDTTLEPTRIYLGNMEESQRQLVQLKEQEYIDELRQKKIGLNKQRNFLTNEELMKLPLHRSVDFESDDVPLKEESTLKEEPSKDKHDDAERQKLAKYRMYAQGEFVPDPDFEPASEPKSSDSVNFAKLDESDPRFTGYRPREDDSVYDTAINPETKKKIPVLAPRNQEDFKDDLKLYKMGYFEPELEPNISFATSSKLDISNHPGSKKKQQKTAALAEEESLNATYHLLQNLGPEDLVGMRQQQDEYRGSLTKYKLTTLGAVPNNVKLEFSKDDDDEDQQIKSDPKNILGTANTQRKSLSEESSAENTFLHIRKYKVTDAEAYRNNQKKVKESLEKLGLNVEVAEPTVKKEPDLAGLKESHSNLMDPDKPIREDSSMGTFEIMKNIAREPDLYTFKKTQMKLRQDLGDLQVAIIPGEFINPEPKPLDLTQADIPIMRPEDESALSEELSRLGLREEDTIQDEIQLLQKLKVKDLYQVRGRVAKYKQELKEYELKTAEIDPAPLRVPKRKLNFALNKSLDESKLSKQGIREESSIENTFIMMQRKGLQDIAKVHKLQGEFQSQVDKYNLGYFPSSVLAAPPKEIDFSDSNIMRATREPREESTLESQLLLKQLGAKDKFQMRLKQAEYRDILLANQVYFVEDHLVSSKLKDLSYDFKSAEMTQPLDEEDTEPSRVSNKATPAGDMAKVKAKEELEKLGFRAFGQQDPNQSWSVANFIDFHNYKRQYRVWKNREEDLLRKKDRIVLQQTTQRTSRSADTSFVGNDVSYGVVGKPFTKAQRFVPKQDDSVMQKSRMRLSANDKIQITNVKSQDPVALGIDLKTIPDEKYKKQLQDQAKSTPLQAQKKQTGDMGQTPYFKISMAPANESFEYNDYREVEDPSKRAQKLRADLNQQRLPSLQPVPDTGTQPAPVTQTDPVVSPATNKRDLWSLQTEYQSKHTSVLSKAKTKAQRSDRPRKGEKLFKDTALQRIVVKMRRMEGLDVVQEEADEAGDGGEVLEEDLDADGGTVAGIRAVGKKGIPEPTGLGSSLWRKGKNARGRMGDGRATMDLGNGVVVADGSGVFGGSLDESSIGPGIKGVSGRDFDEGKSILQESLFADLLKEKSNDAPAKQIQQPVKKRKSIVEPPAPKLNKLNKPAYDHFDTNFILPGKKQREVDFIPEPKIQVSKQKKSPKTDEPSNNPVLYGDDTQNNDLGKLGMGIDLGSAGVGDQAPVKVKRQDDEYQPFGKSQVPVRPNIYVKGNKAVEDLSQTMMGPAEEQDDGFDLQAEIRRNALGI